MGFTRLRADCGRCAALCCVSLAFDASARFAQDKPAGVPCRQLTGDDRCAIHSERGQRGFSGCVDYECLGAGQRVTQELFGGRSWREDAALARDMFDAFRAMRQVQELMQLLETAGALPLSPEQDQQRRRLQACLDPPSRWSRDALREFEHGPLAGEVLVFLRTLRNIAEREGSGFGGSPATRRRHLAIVD